MEKPSEVRQALTMQQQIFVSTLLNPVETAKLLGTTAGSLAVWRSTRRYSLRFVKVGRKVFYRAEDVQAFIESRTHEGTSADASRGRKQAA